MKHLLSKLDAVIRTEGLSWKRDRNTVEVELWRSGRRQRVHLKRSDDLYIFWSTVVGPSYVTKSGARWRDLAYNVWRKNALKDLVAFSFDAQDRLVGRIEQPATTLDDNELILYVETLAEECDRFEYKLTGEDRS